MESRGERRNKSLGRALARMRIAAGMTQAELAARTGIPQTTISKWEASGIPIVDPVVVGRMRALEKAAGVRAGYLDRTAVIGAVRPEHMSIEDRIMRPDFPDEFRDSVYDMLEAVERTVGVIIRRTRT